MPFSVNAYADDHKLTVTTETAKEAFGRAVDWHIAQRFTDISIFDGIRSYGIVEFSSVMALLEIANAVPEADTELGLKVKAK